MKKLHLLSNAHLDPVWQWEWEEGAAAAVSTFRAAAEFCEEHDGYIFNHNEVILYQWVEEYEPLLFGRIQRLVQEGKWRIMGGWYLQPDCNMISGESFVRQILLGKAYFREKFGAEPTTAINFDSFGHTRGLVQILQQAGYDSYIFMRLSAAALQGLLPYPDRDLHEALRDLLTVQFHDILPGSSVQNAEEASLRQLGHGLEILARLKARAFFALAAGQPKAAPKEYPVLIYNPHPFAVKGVWECEFMLEDQNWKEEFSMPVVYQDEKRLPCQPEKERSNIPLDWRKRAAFTAELAPSSMNRFDCRIAMLPFKPLTLLKEQNGGFRFETAELLVVINAQTGLMDEYAVRGTAYLHPGAFAPLVLKDNEDPWRMDITAFDEPEGRFSLMNAEESALFSGVKHPLAAVRVIEDGEVRTVIEAVLKYGSSSICQIYKLPKQGTEVEIELRVYWNEKDKLLKLSIPTVLEQGDYMGQTAFGVNPLNREGQETVAQKWISVEDAAQKLAVTCINNGSYGGDFRDGEVRLSLLRSAGYCAHPIGDRPIMPQDRFQPRMDQGERCYTFWLNAGGLADRRARVDREALVHNERPYALSFFPSGEGEQPGPCVILEDDSVQLSAFKKEEDGGGFILRLFEPTGSGGATMVSLPELGIRQAVSLNGFEIRTYRVQLSSRMLEEVPLCERGTLEN